MLIELLIFRTGDLELVSRLEGAMATDLAAAHVAADLLAEDGRLSLECNCAMAMAEASGMVQVGREIARLQDDAFTYDFVGVTVEGAHVEHGIELRVALDHTVQPGIEPPVRLARQRTVLVDETAVFLPGGDVVVLARPTLAPAAPSPRVEAAAAFDTLTRRGRAHAIEALLGAEVTLLAP